LIARADRVIADIGTGDGRAVLARARAEPAALVVGIDAAAAAMTEASLRAARRGPANAIFLAAGVETLADTVLVGRMDLVTVTFPWGSLLRGVLGLDPAALAGVAALVAPGKCVEVLASVMPSDGVGGIATLDASWEPAICRAWAAASVAAVPSACPWPATCPVTLSDQSLMNVRRSMSIRAMLGRTSADSSSRSHCQ
jgi:16S rRNA (adenine(1408)-N(1))-methyltransferase